MENKPENMEKIVSLCKRRGFIFQGSEIYGGLAGTWDYGPLGLALKNNIKNSWWKTFVEGREDIFGLDAAIIMNPKVWETSGHVSGFSDLMKSCVKCGSQFRSDQLPENTMKPDGSEPCPKCGTDLSPDLTFNTMFKTSVGAGEESTTSYLRPETAQGIFVNFKNIIDTFHPKIPFGIGQIGKAFRNEIAPRDFIFRSREFEQMEVEYFVREEDWEKYFEEWRSVMQDWMKRIGILLDGVHELEVSENDRAHYSKRTIDFEFDFPFGRKELFGLAYRTDYDLKKHSEGSGVELNYLDDSSGERFIPHVIEPSLGVDRAVLAVLTSAFCEDDMGGEKRTFLKLESDIAPVSVAVFPLLKNKPNLVEKSREVYKLLKEKNSRIVFDDNGNIGKRYRRQDEIGTPYCVTIDFDTLEDDTVTLRDRDSGEQERVKIGELIGRVKI